MKRRVIALIPALLIAAVLIPATAAPVAAGFDSREAWVIGSAHSFECVGSGCKDTVLTPSNGCNVNPAPNFWWQYNKTGPTALSGKTWSQTDKSCKGDWESNGTPVGTAKGTITSFAYTETWQDGIPTKVTVSANLSSRAEKTGSGSDEFDGRAAGKYLLRFTTSKAVDIRLKANVTKTGLAGVNKVKATYRVNGVGGFGSGEGAGGDTFDQTKSLNPGTYNLEVVLNVRTCDDGAGSGCDALAASSVRPAALATATGTIDATFTITTKTATCDINGTSGDDVLVGTSAGERICGFGGNDVIKGNGGNDVLLGGPGNDRILGGKGNDVIKGEGGKDKLLGGAGHDRIFGGNGNDELTGGSGNDVVAGGSGSDIIRGSAGKDTLKAKDNKRDKLDGGPGFDKGKWDRGKDRVVRVEKRL
jgi:Ca2+-binding RTX toxin-like protein